MNFSKLTQFMQQMPYRGYPSCELAVTKNGETVFRTSVGCSQLATARPASPNDLYWIYSCTKVITCIAALRLLEEGKIALDDPVAKYLPEYADLQVLQEDGSTRPAQTQLTLLHLFTMTGGLTYDTKTPAIQAAITPEATTRDIVAAMAKDPLAFEPGTHYRYSLCHDVLGAVIEVASGMRLSTYMQTFIFDPLGITDMGFHPAPEQFSRFVDMYKGKSGTNRSEPVPCTNTLMLSPLYDGGGAGLFASVDEYMKIITVIANGGTAANGYRLLRPETIALAQKNLLHDDALNDFSVRRLHGYGWGLCGRVHRDPVISFSPSAVGEFGWDSAAGAFSLIDPENRVALLFGAHIKSYQYGAYHVHPMLRTLVYECLQTK